MNPRLELTNDQLSTIVALALNKTEDEIINSETFEQSVYNMARSINSNLPEIDVSKKAQYSNSHGFIHITYRLRVPLDEIAKFYNSYFPETQPTATHGSMYDDDSISFIAGPFIEKVLPAMKLWNEMPSQLSQILHEDLEATKKGPSISVLRC